MMTKLSSLSDYSLDLAHSIANFGSDALVSVTKVLNNDLLPSAVDQFMDTAKGIGHRIEFGHSLDQLPTIIEKFGWSKGLTEYSTHIAKDLMSSHGVPMPYAKEIAEMLGLSPMEAVNWLCLNIGDIVAGGLSITHSAYMTRQLLRAKAEGDVSSWLIIRSAVSAGIKIGGSCISPNPIGVASGIWDLGVIAYVTIPLLIQSVERLDSKRPIHFEGTSMLAQPVLLAVLGIVEFKAATQALAH